MKSMDRQCLLNLGVIVGKSTVMHSSSLATTLTDGRDLVAVGRPWQHYSQPARTAASVGALAHHVLAELWRQWLSQHRLTVNLERGKIVPLTALC